MYSAAAEPVFYAEEGNPNSRTSDKKAFNGSREMALIEFVREHPILYQQKNPDYKEVKKKEKVWQEIADRLKRTVRECKTRWKLIRDSYKKTKNRMRNRDTSTVAIWACPRSKYNTAYLSFLDDSFNDRVVSTREMYLEKLAKLNVHQPMLLPDDSSSQDKTRPEEPPPMLNNTALKPTAEVIDIDIMEDIKPIIPPTEANYIIPDPVTQDQLESSPLVILRRYISPDSDLDTGLNQTPNGTSTSNTSADENRLQQQQQLQPVYEPTATLQPNPPPARKRPLNPKSTVSAKKRKEHQEMSSVQTGAELVAHTGFGTDMAAHRGAGAELVAHRGAGPVPEHPIETFFRSMALTVMSFPPHIAAETRLEVCRIVTQMEMRAYSEQNPCFGPRIVSSGSALADDIQEIIE